MCEIPLAIIREQLWIISHITIDPTVCVHVFVLVHIVPRIYAHANVVKLRIIGCLLLGDAAAVIYNMFGLAGLQHRHSLLYQDLVGCG